MRKSDQYFLETHCIRSQNSYFLSVAHCIQIENCTKREFVKHTSSTMLIKIVYSIVVLFPIASGLPEDIDCFEANFPTKLQSSKDDSSVQWIKIEQVLQFFSRVNGTSESNETSVFTISFGLRPEENITYHYDIESQGNTKQKRQLSLGYKGRYVYGAIGFHSCF